jgi:PadR family transcriptional regulator PadR
MARLALSGHLDLLLLAALRHGERHGYALIADLRERSGGAFDYPEGTVYPALRRLEDEGLVTSAWSEVDNRRRRVYRLTTAGTKALAGQQAEWERFAGNVRAVLGT